LWRDLRTPIFACYIYWLGGAKQTPSQMERVSELPGEVDGRSGSDRKVWASQAVLCDMFEVERVESKRHFDLRCEVFVL
jgi:hypothetical protein